ncbi:MAG: HIT family protein [Bacteroidetes bacterium]|nr:HIT family protein [Bacteroidota bacterium]MBU1718930.1 HIT family protein [Bacteroidota bacterium]
MVTIFSKIVSGEIPCYKVAEDDRFLAFLDINPLSKGHTLVIPKIETDYIFDINDNDYQAFFLFAKRVAKAIDRVVPSTKIGIAVIGLEVAHAHIHLVPQQNMGTLNFANPKLKFSTEEFNQIATEIGAAF